MNTDKTYAEKIASEYAPKETRKVVALKKLDAKAKMPANVFSYTFGIIMALVLHDGCKLGLPKEEYTKIEHPLIVSKLIMEHHNELQMDIIEVRKLCTMIEAHMGKWNKDYKGNEILPIPRNEIERFLHKCDYLSSRKFLNIKFKKMEISEE